MNKRYLANEFQKTGECADFVATLRDQGIRSYLEIGSKYGGSLWQVARSMPKGSRLVAVDMVDSFELKQCVADIKEFGHDITLVVGDSTDQKTIDAVSALGPFDAVLIDGNHSMSYVTKDWENYGSLGRIVAFHDIGAPEIIPAKKPWKADVSLFWKSIRDQYRHTEIIAPDGIGFGVLFRGG